MFLLESPFNELSLPGRKIVPADNIMAVRQQPVGKVASDKAGGAGNKTLS